MTVYPDTSFLVSLYVLDSHSTRVVPVMISRPNLILTPLIELELTNAIELDTFRQRIRPDEAQRAHAAFREDIDAGVYSLRPVPADAYETAGRVSRRRSAQLGTRALDILHVACALNLGANKFYTFDGRQREIARAEGLDSPSF